MTENSSLRRSGPDNPQAARIGMSIVFTSKRDSWIVATIWAGALLSVGGGVAQLSSTASLASRFALFTLLVSAAAFMLWALYSTYYTLTDEHLLIRCGPLRYRVPLVEIDMVKPSRSWLSSPAISLDRLLIKWNEGRKTILISPSRKMDFLQELGRRCEQLNTDGDRLVRGPAGA